MKHCLIVVCGVLFALQSFAAGKAVSQELLARVKGRLATVAAKSALHGVAIGTALLLAAGASDSHADYWEDDAVRHRKIDRGDIAISFLGDYSASDVLTTGFSLGTLLHGDKTDFRIKSGVTSVITTENTWDDGYTIEGNDYLVRMQMLRFVEDRLVFVSMGGGGAQYANLRRQFDIGAGFGFRFANFGGGLLGEGAELQISADTGWYGASNYEELLDGFDDELEANSPYAGFSVRLKTEGVSIGDLVEADAGSLLHYMLFIIPKVDLEYRGFVYGEVADYNACRGVYANKAKTGYALAAKVCPIPWLGISAEFNDIMNNDTDDLHKRILAVFSLNFGR